MSAASISFRPLAPYSLEDTRWFLDRYEDGVVSGDRVTLAEEGYTADDFTFADYVTNCRLAEQGIFSIDRKANRAAREAEAQRQADLDEAYAVVGVDRAKAYGRILSLMEGKRTGGIWARSTSEYANARDALDELILIRAAKALAVDLRVHDHGSILVAELVSDEAKAWVRDSVEVPEWARMGNRGIAVDPRLLGAFVTSARADGLRVAA